MRILPAAMLLALASSACSGDTDGSRPPDDAPAPITLSFRPEELQTGTEDYLCYGFDAAELAGLAVERIAWSPPEGGGVSLHHATLYALQDPFPDGPLS